MSFIQLPQQCGISPWFALNRYKDYKFASREDLKKDYDYIVVGAGFGGVSAAYRLVENHPSCSVLLLDADSIGNGSSGRNAGFVSVAQIARAIVGPQRFTTEDQKWLIKLNGIAVDRILKIKKEKNLDFIWRQDGMYKAVRELRNQHKLDDLARTFDALGISYEQVDTDDLCQRLGTDFYKKALFLKETYLNNPSEAIRALSTALPENVTVLENTAVCHVSEGEIPYVVLDDGTQIKCRKIILTISAYLKHFYRQHSKNITAIHSFAGMTRPLNDDELQQFKDVKPWGITGTHPSSATVRFTHDNRLFVRTDISYARNLNINPARMYKALEVIKKAYDKRFTKLTHVPFEYVYGGLISFTGNTCPFFGEVGKNVVAGVSGEGSGVTRAAILGNYLADLVTGVKSEELNYILNKYTPSYLPSDPLRTIGAIGAIGYNNLIAGAEL